MQETANALFEAHVRHELRTLEADAFAAFLRAEVEQLFSWLESVTLGQVANRDWVMRIIERRVIHLRISPGIAEIAGEGADAVVSSPCNADTTLGDIMPAETIDDLVDKIVGLREARRSIIEQVASSDAYRILVERLLQTAVHAYLFNPEGAAERSSLTSAVGRRLFRRVLPGLERRVAGSLSRFLDEHAERLAQEGEHVLTEVLDDELIRCAADEAFEQMARQRLDRLYPLVGSYDLEDFIVIGYEFWLKFRKTKYFHAVTRAVVERFFDKYEEQSVRFLVEDMGVTGAMVCEDYLDVLAPLVAHALQTGYAERRIRERLGRFYGSEEVAALVSKGA